MTFFLSLIALVVYIILFVVVVVIGFVIGQMIWAGLCVAAVYHLKPKGKRAPWIAGLVPAFAPTYLLVIVLGLWWVWPDKYDAYEVGFDKSVSPSVTIHDGRIAGLGTWTTIDLYFSATPADIQALTGRSLTLNPPTNGTEQTYFGAVPLTGKDVYEGVSPNARHSVENAKLIYDASTGEAWYSYRGSQ